MTSILQMDIVEEEKSMPDDPCVNPHAGSNSDDLKRNLVRREERRGSARFNVRCYDPILVSKVN